MRLRSHRGFTLIEMIMVILILGIIIAMSSTLLTQGLDTFSTGENIMNANWQGQLAMERMARDILSVRSPADMTTLGASNFAFTDSNNNTLSYSLSGTSLNLTQNGSTAILADGIQSLGFSYFDKNDAATTTPTLARFIRVTINVTQGNANYTLTTGIYPRNLP
jgi:prepilin-type N-terminal cleavage/methylation domain-containing protein